MKKQLLMILMFAFTCAISSVASTDYRPPGKEQSKSELVSSIEKQADVITYHYLPFELPITYLTGNTPEAKPNSIVVCVSASEGVAEVSQHDYGNIQNNTRVALFRKPADVNHFKRIYLLNRAIRQC